uniref:DUF6613 domain-containing protein n=1 Tax=uncultured Candidatus Melainabacteria bacterium TaxID=2682970 RepID=A0A650EL06_9BACT|nr:hypothetical protein Melaina855_1850 [uncultured Candidatus Melainabacteria bacterium]
MIFNDNKQNKTAFTLAEVLITLGIIGVVAALTIPGLITEHQKRATVTKLQRAISVINQAYRMSFDDVGEPISAYEIKSDEYFKTYWAPYIKALTYCSKPQDCGYNSNGPFSHPNGQKSPTALISETMRTTFYTADGFLYIIFVGGGTSKPGETQALNWVWVDINGGTKPNEFGKDVFFFIRQTDGKGVQPYGQSLTDAKINADCSKTGTGQYCAEKIRRNGWKISKDYPW